MLAGIGAHPHSAVPPGLVQIGKHRVQVCRWLVSEGMTAHR